MQLDQGICYRALRTRDARFDGRFFTAVRSTGSYCRPICALAESWRPWRSYAALLLWSTST